MKLIDYIYLCGPLDDNDPRESALIAGIIDGVKIGLILLAFYFL